MKRVNSVNLFWYPFTWLPSKVTQSSDGSFYFPLEYMRPNLQIFTVPTLKYSIACLYIYNMHRVCLLIVASESDIFVVILMLRCPGFFSDYCLCDCAAALFCIKWEWNVSIERQLSKQSCFLYIFTRRPHDLWAVVFFFSAKAWHLYREAENIMNPFERNMHAGSIVRRDCGNRGNYEVLLVRL